MRSRIGVIVCMIVFTCSTAWAATVGKITGTIRDAENGLPLGGVNIILEGSSMGAATDMNGYYVILNVPPGLYSMKAMMIGYAPVKYTDVGVNVEITTTVDFSLRIQSLEGEEVVVVAERKVVKRDVSSSQLNITMEQINDLPVTSIDGVLAMHAGIEGMSVRRGDENELALLIDGVTLKDDRTGNPVSGIPLSSVQEVMIQSGGFTAEYSDLQSGVINVITKEGKIDKYSLNINTKYSPASAKHFGISVFDENSYYLRPYLDEDVCWVGTESGDWDQTMQERYPYFEGWNTVSARTMSNDDPGDDLSPIAAKRIFEWQHRRVGNITKPDYNIDMGLGGPIPFFSEKLGNARFYSSFGANKDMYLVPLSRDDYSDWVWTNKITSDITDRIRLQLSMFMKEIKAASSSGEGNPSYFSGLWDVASAFDYDSQQASKIFYPDYYCNTDISTRMLSAKLTHQISNRTYYEGKIEYRNTKYDTYPGRLRDITETYDIMPGPETLYVNEAPWGYEQGLVSSIDGYMMGAKTNSRDSTQTYSLNAEFNFVSQVTATNQIKAGGKIDYYNYDMNYGAINPALPSGRPWTRWQKSPFQIGLYVQEKLEFEGWIANLGLRMEYFNPNSDWYDLDAFNRPFYSQNYRPYNEGDFTQKAAKSLVTFLPRIGISHPITINSKLYFNYGHMRQKFSPDALFSTRRVTGYRLSYVGDPELPMEKTIAYELGYDHSLFDEYLIHVAAYYKDKSDQQSSISYSTSDGTVSYSQAANIAYQDVRGLEIEMQKRMGAWFTGFVNYNYSVYTSGQFGYRKRYEDPAEQREYEKNINEQAQYKPRTLPKIKYNLSFHVPFDLGGSRMNSLLLGGWNLSMTGSWQKGSYATYGNISGIVDNVRWRDIYNLDLRLSKTVRFNKVQVTLMTDIFNALNIKRLSYAGLGDPYMTSNATDNYLNSLHFKQSVYEELSANHISGDDKLGNYRPSNVDYQPMEWINKFSDFSSADERVFYYVGNLADLQNYFPDANLSAGIAAMDRYVQFVDGAWVRVPKKDVQEALDSKAYIRNPVNESFLFLAPRDIFIGLKISFDI